MREDGLVDGALAARLRELEGLLEELAWRLADAERGAAYPQHDLERVVGRGGPGAGLDAKAPPRDAEVRELRRIYARWKWRLRRVVREMEADLYEDGQTGA